MTTNASQSSVGTEEQYSLAKILGIWLLAATPMGLLIWVVFPALKDSVAIQPEIFFFALNVAGLMWRRRREIPVRTRDGIPEIIIGFPGEVKKHPG